MNSRLHASPTVPAYVVDKAFAALNNDKDESINNDNNKLDANVAISMVPTVSDVAISVAPTAETASPHSAKNERSGDSEVGREPCGLAVKSRRQRIPTERVKALAGTAVQGRSRSRDKAKGRAQ